MLLCKLSIKIFNQSLKGRGSLSTERIQLTRRELLWLTDLMDSLQRRAIQICWQTKCCQTVLLMILMPSKILTYLIRICAQKHPVAAMIHVASPFHQHNTNTRKRVESDPDQNIPILQALRNRVVEFQNSSPLRTVVMDNKIAFFGYERYVHSSWLPSLATGLSFVWI